MTTKQEQKIFEFKHKSGDVFTYNNENHEYKLNGIELPGTTTPLELVNELSWDDNGKMSSKSQIIQKWAINKVVEFIQTALKKKQNWKANEVELLTEQSKGAPNESFTSAGISGTKIHDEIEKLIKHAIKEQDGWLAPYEHELPQVGNFIVWAVKNKVRFLYSEEPIYSKEWMNCGTVDFVCEIDGRTLVGDIKTNGDKRRYYWDGKKYDTTRPVSDIHTNALFQVGAYSKMITEEGARKLVDKADGVVIVNIKKSGIFDEKLDVRYDYDVKSLIDAYEHIISLYKIYRRK